MLKYDYDHSYGMLTRAISVAKYKVFANPKFLGALSGHKENFDRSEITGLQLKDLLQKFGGEIEIQTAKKLNIFTNWMGFHQTGKIYFRKGLIKGNKISVEELASRLSTMTLMAIAFFEGIEIENEEDENRKNQNTAPIWIRKTALTVIRDFGRIDLKQGAEHARGHLCTNNPGENLIFIDAERAIEVFQYAVKYNEMHSDKNTKAYVAGMLGTMKDQSEADKKRFTMVFFPAALNEFNDGPLPDEVAGDYTNFKRGVLKDGETPIIHETWIDPIQSNTKENLEEVINHFLAEENNKKNDQ